MEGDVGVAVEDDHGVAVFGVVSFFEAVGDGGSAVAGARVALSSPVKRTATTDSQGDYRFTGLPAGRYSLFAGAPQLVLPKAIPVMVGTAK